MRKTGSGSRGSARLWAGPGWAALCCLFFAASMPAEPATQATDKFDGVMSPVVAHTSWTGRDGAPQNVSALAQTTDGYLWMGTPFGLFRFDGIDFASYPTTSLSAPLPSTDIEALSSDAAGGLWIGFRSGGISHLRANGAVENYNPHNHLGPNSAQNFIVCNDGAVWAVADYRLYRLAGNHWENFGVQHGLSGNPLFSIFLDKAGTLWTSTRSTLFALKKGQSKFEVFPTKSFMIVGMVQAPDGEMWVADAWNTIRPLVPNSIHPGWNINGYVRMVMEPSGNLWLAQDYRGVTHMQLGKTPSPLVKETELSSEQTTAILLDRDGDIWVGTSRGLDRYHSTSLQKLSNTRVEYYPALAADPHHGVWLATLSHPIVYAAGGALKPAGGPVGSSPVVCDDSGAVWMVDPITNKLTRWNQSATTLIDIPNDVHQAPAQSIGLDRDGAILVSFKPNGLWRYDGNWTRIQDPALPTDDPLSIVRDGQKRIWLGYANDTIALQDETGYHLLSAEPNRGLGNILTFTSADGRMWAGGTNGVAYFSEGSFHRVSLARGGSLKGVSGLAEDAQGNLWLNASTGILRIPRDQLQNLPQTQTQLEYDLIDDRQGVLGTATQLKPTPSVVADKDGLLWFATSGQLLSLAPQTFSAGRKAPALSVERVIVDGTAISDREHPSPGISFKSSDMKELEIDYIGIDLAAPEKIAYRYMLEGEDKTWHDVANRRQAFYTHLNPGRYRFRLLAASGNNPWIELATPLSITVTPVFYQTPWFIAIIVVMSGCLLYLAYILRVRYLTGNLQRRLKERVDERMRIARELHDTLLQSIHGLMLRIHFAVEELPEEEPVRKPLQLALQRADDVFVEARQRIEFLRDEIPEEPDFALQLAKVAEDLDLHGVMSFQIVEDGERRFLHTDVQGELCRIAREAIVNTLHHANAKSAEISLGYGKTELSMKCSDTGIGIPPDVLRSGRRSGHWGLIGMKERAASIEAKFQVWSTPGAGTQIEIRVPAKRAYRFPASNSRWLQQLRQFRRSATGQDTQT